MGGRWAVAIVALVLVGAARVAPGDREAQATDAMAFIRVVADVRVDFGGMRAPVERKGVELATGSGFVVAPSGLVVTSLHVVSDEPLPKGVAELEGEVSIEGRRIEVAIGSSGAVGVFEAHVVAKDAEGDLAALQVTAADLPYLPLGDSDAVDPGRPVKVLGFPFGRRVDVGKRADAGAVPGVSVTRGSLSAARGDERGETRLLQTDAAVHPGNSGGPMLDEDGYVVGVVRSKLARDATSPGAGFSVPVNVVKDFLEGGGLLDRLPVARLRPGVRHTLDWKRLAIELPEGYSDLSASRVLFDGGEVGEIGFRAFRLATGWPVAAVEEAILSGREVPGFVPAPAVPGQRRSAARRLAVALATLTPLALIGSAGGTDESGGAFRVEYGIVDLEGETLVARFVGPADAMAFNLGLVRRSLLSLEAAQMLSELPAHSMEGARGLALEAVGFPEGEGRVSAPSGWALEPAAQAACADLPPPDNGLSASHPHDYTLVLRALRWTTGGPSLDQAVEACGGSGYAVRLQRLGVPIEARGLLVQREGDRLLLELEAPVAKLPIVEGLYEHWVREVAAAR